MGLLALAGGVLLLAATGFRLGSVFAAGSATAFLVAAYTFAYAELVAVTLALSDGHLVTTAGLLVTLAAVCVATFAVTWRRPLALPVRTWVSRAREPLRDPIVLVLACAVLLGLAYVLVLTLTTPQDDVDTLYDHLWRAAVWRHHHAVGYPFCACAPYINAYPPNGEIGLLFTLVLGASDRYAGLVQLTACIAMVVAVIGIARRFGLSRRESLFGGLLVATFPIVALQASTGQNDLVTAAGLLAGTLFLLDGARWSPLLAALAMGIGIGTKITALIAIPILFAVAWLARPVGRRLARLAGVVAGCALGAYWYVVNTVETGKWDGGYPAIYVDRHVAPIIARVFRVGLEFIDLSGAIGWDRWLYAATAAIVFVAVAGFSYRRWRSAAVAFVCGSTPLILLPLAHLLVRANNKLWYSVGRRDLAFDPGHDITQAASNYSWFGPLGSLLLVGAGVAVIVLVRRRKLDRMAVLATLAPWYWLIVFSIALFYQPFAGRFFVYPFALAAATWGIVLRVRPVAWGVVAIAPLALAFALVNDHKRPAGVPIAPHFKSIWSTPRWLSQGRETHDPDILRYADAHLPRGATLALNLVPHFNGYVFLGGGLDRQFDLIGPATRDAPGATWAFVYPTGTSSLCAKDWRKVADVYPGWQVYRRVRTGPC